MKKIIKITGILLVMVFSCILSFSVNISGQSDINFTDFVTLNTASAESNDVNPPLRFKAIYPDCAPRSETRQEVVFDAFTDGTSDLNNDPNVEVLGAYGSDEEGYWVTIQITEMVQQQRRVCVIGFGFCLWDTDCFDA